MLDEDRVTEPCVLAANDLPIERFADPSYGTVSWQTLFTADRTPTRDLTCGLAHLATGDCLALHRHAQAEIYFGVSGTARVMIDGTAHAIGPGVAVFIPGGAVHGIFADTEAAQFFYAFATDSFADVEYQFLADAAPELVPVDVAADPAMPDLLDPTPEIYLGDYPVQ
jgi:quercetin dioxygenase-like cupin family protein